LNSFGEANNQEIVPNINVPIIPVRITPAIKIYQFTVRVLPSVIAIRTNQLKSRGLPSVTATKTDALTQNNSTLK